MISRQIIKENAKLQLGNNIFGNNWLLALLVVLIQTAVVGAVSATVSILGVLILGPFTVGVTSVFVNLMRQNKPIDIADMFDGFKVSLSRNILLSLLVTLFTTLWSLLFIIPGIVKYYSYSMAYFIANDHPEYDWNTCIKESMRLTNGHKMDLFVLDLSFIGWYFVGALCLGIGTLWVAPYHFASKQNYYEAILGLQNATYQAD